MVLQTLDEEGDVTLPVGLAVFAVHEVAAHVVAHRARLTVVVLRRLDVVVVGEHLVPQTALGGGVVLADDTVGAEEQLGRLLEGNSVDGLVLLLDEEAARHTSEELWFYAVQAYSLHVHPTTITQQYPRSPSPRSSSTSG